MYIAASHQFKKHSYAIITALFLSIAVPKQVHSGFSEDMRKVIPVVVPILFLAVEFSDAGNPGPLRTPALFCVFFVVGHWINTLIDSGNEVVKDVSSFVRKKSKERIGYFFDHQDPETLVKKVLSRACLESRAFLPRDVQGRIEHAERQKKQPFYIVPILYGLGDPSHPLNFVMGELFQKIRQSQSSAASAQRDDRLLRTIVSVIVVELRNNRELTADIVKTAISHGIHAVQESILTISDTVSAQLAARINSSEMTEGLQRALALQGSHESADLRELIASTKNDPSFFLRVLVLYTLKNDPALFMMFQEISSLWRQEEARR